MRIKLFAILWFLGFLGVLSLLGMDFPLPEGTELQFPIWGIKLLSLIQPTVLLSLSVFIGIQLAPKVGLSAPFCEAIIRGNSLISALKLQIIPGLIGGILGGMILGLIQGLAQVLLPADFVTKAEVLSRNTPFLTRLLYGGITEELLLRWGLMTLFVWVGWRLFSKGKGEPPALIFIGAIIFSSLIFALGHLPLVFLLGTLVTPAIIAYVMIGNSVFGFMAGYLYWQKGLEAAMLAHILVHVVLVTAHQFLS